MDIVTHTLTGMTFAYTLTIAFSGNRKDKITAVGMGAMGGMLPDLDAISMWSGFDGTFGKLFHLSLPGKAIYSGKLWYSHHGFMHSLMAALLFTLLTGIVLWLCHYKKSKRILLFSFAGGFIFHLLQDMITPASAWGGVRIFFPSITYIGGTGDIWWWNNYDLFLIVALVFTGNLIISVCKLNKKKKLLYSGGCFLLGSLLFTVQVKTRNFNFNKHTYQENETKSLQIQQKILPEPVYKGMERLDRFLIVHF